MCLVHGSDCIARFHNHGLVILLLCFVILKHSAINDPFSLEALRNESSGTMTTIIGTAISTSNDVPSLEPSDVNGSVPTNHNTQLNGQPTRNWEKRYRHIAAVHSRPRTSCLSHDSDAAPSFLGFRNLMVIVLRTWNPAACVTSVHDGKLPDTICQL